jgi:hypothetical protein
MEETVVCPVTDTMGSSVSSFSVATAWPGDADSDGRVDINDGNRVGTA